MKLTTYTLDTNEQIPAQEFALDETGLITSVAAQSGFAIYTLVAGEEDSMLLYPGLHTVNRCAYVLIDLADLQRKIDLKKFPFYFLGGQNWPIFELA